MATMAPSMTREQIFIGGEWVDPAPGADTVEVVNPATEESLGTVPLCTAADVDSAVEAAREGFEIWSRVSIADRADALDAVGAALAARSEEIAATITREMGMPIALSTQIQAGLPTMTFGSQRQMIESVEWEQQVGNSLILREAAGVLGAITPWNYPLHQIAAKVAPALSAGCTVVLKPSEVAPLNAFILAEIIESVGLPAGVFNLVTGTGPEVGEAIASHPGIDLVSFTGSTRAGKRVSELASATVKPVAMELGGKSANVILEGSDLSKAIPNAVAKCLLNSGQTCSALTRLIVPRETLEAVEQIAVGTIQAAFMPGDVFDPEIRIGPLVSDVQRDRVRGYIEKGIAEGARLVCGGIDQPEGLPTGYYVSPTIFSDVTSDMTIAQEEIFGPVLAILPYDDAEDAARIANDSIYGLAGGVWGPDEAEAIDFAKRIRTGQVEINGGAFNPLAPFGGYKQSGHGRELGHFALEEFLQVKSLQL